jgi:hypothetical protein
VAATPNDVPQAKRVIALGNEPDLAHGYLRTYMTEGVLRQLITKEGWNGRHLASVQVQRPMDNLYMWYRDRGEPNGRFDRGTDEVAWKPYPADRHLTKDKATLRQIEDDLLDGWQPVYKVGMQSEITTIEFHAAARPVLEDIYANHLMLSARP